MKMTIVSAYHTIQTPKFDLIAKPELEGKTANSFRGIAQHLTDGDIATVAIPGKGYKSISIREGQLYIQRNYVCEY